MSEILKAVKKNLERLNACKGPHVFISNKEINGVSVEYVCPKCEATVSSTYAIAYQAGLQHGAKQTI